MVLICKETNVFSWFSWGSNRFLDRRQEALNVYFNEVISIATNSIRSTADTQHSAWSLIAKELDTFLSVEWTSVDKI